MRRWPLLVALISGCATLQPPLTAPRDGGAAWTEARSAHFILRTDMPEDEAVMGASPFAFTRGGGHGGVLAVDNLLSATALVSLHPNEFYKGDGEEVEERYAAAWLLVSMLITGPDDGRKRFWAYAHDLTE